MISQFFYFYFKDGQLYYKVKWVKYTWEAEESIQHLPHLIDGYWREHFYTNINQAVIDTTGITTAVNTTEASDFTRNKSIVVNPADARDVKVYSLTNFFFSKRKLIFSTVIINDREIFF